MSGISGNQVEALPKFTIIIAVTHSIDCLRECLESLDRLDSPKELFHVVLIDCHVLNGLKQFFGVKLKEYNCRITAVALPEQRRKYKAWLHEARLNEARNYAMEKVPGQYFVFTEDDCMFEPDWLTKFDEVLSDDLGAAAGPDILPEGMDCLPRALDCILNSFIGTAGGKRGDGFKKEWYYPRKENTLIPAKVIKRIGKFPENMIFGAEMEIAKRIRDIGLKIKYLPDNPVWHRRITTFRNFFRRNVYHAAEKVRLLRKQHVFIRSPHFLVLVAAATGFFLGLFAIINPFARALFWVMCCCYVAIMLFMAASSFMRTRSLRVGLGVLLLLPTHHSSIITGVLKGAVSRVGDRGE